MTGRHDASRRIGLASWFGVEFHYKAAKLGLLQTVMADNYERLLHDLAAKIGKFPVDAYHFVREGLGYAVNRIHGPESAAQIAVIRFLAANDMDLDELRALYENGELDQAMVNTISEAGGIDQLNRHVSGSELCWGLREYAQHRWGKLASMVLNNWHIDRTDDFGELVFAMIEYDLMQKQPGDSLEDFKNVYSFEEALDSSYKITFNGN